MKDKEYHLLESPYFNGGVKVKFLNQTCAQFPNIDLAINYIKKTCYNEKQLYSTIDLIKTDGSIEQVDVFDD